MPSTQLDSGGVVPNDSTEILSQLISDEEGQRVYYLTICSDVFDQETMCRPYLLIPQLSCWSDISGSKIALSRNGDGSLAVTASDDLLQEVTFTWHEKRIDVLPIPKTKRLRSGVFENFYQGRPAVAKIACFEWQIPSLTRETWAYCVLTQSQQPDDGPPIAPKFLGHLTENGRVMGFLMEMLEGSCMDREVWGWCMEM
ncbi:hypothetical protein F66182_7520 [Fusarium sp. NRRL 66182]|nr:hypothetical protein F66182_7520 [Fusarium sp. NRRL 66182]